MDQMANGFDKLNLCDILRFVSFKKALFLF